MENHCPKSRFSSKKRIAVCCIAVAVAILAALIVFAVDISQYNTGVVTKISAKTKSHNELELKMTCFLSSGGYSVREVPLDEGEYIGDGMIDYNGDLGQYRIMITFGDMAPHNSFAKRMSEDGIFELTHSTVPLKAKFAFPSDHGFVLYIGSDTPIRVESKADNEWNALCGTIRIPIDVGNSSRD